MPGDEPGVIFEDKDHLRGKNVTVRLVQKPASDSSVWRAPDKRFRGLGFESWSGPSLLFPSRTLART